eukprot:1182410-Prorocentrum_minimum.AAC.7
MFTKSGTSCARTCGDNAFTDEGGEFTGGDDACTDGGGEFTGGDDAFTDRGGEFTGGDDACTDRGGEFTGGDDAFEGLVHVVLGDHPKMQPNRFQGLTRRLNWV